MMWLTWYMKFTFTKPTLVTGIANLFIFLFVYTAVSKLSDISLFQLVLSQSPLLKNYSAWIAWSVPFLELTIAALLFFSFTRSAGLAAALMLMFLFTGYIFYMLLFTPHLPCSCGGILKQLGWKEHLLLNTALTGMAAWAWRQTKYVMDKQEVPVTEPA